MLKLTRLNNATVAINPDHIRFVDVSPDTTINLLGGKKILVRESLDELIAQYIELRRKTHVVPVGSVYRVASEGGLSGVLAGSDMGDDDDEEVL